VGSGTWHPTIYMTAQTQSGSLGRPTSTGIACLSISAFSIVWSRNPQVPDLLCWCYCCCFFHRYCFLLSWSIFSLSFFFQVCSLLLFACATLAGTNELHSLSFVQKRKFISLCSVCLLPSVSVCAFVLGVAPFSRRLLSSCGRVLREEGVNNGRG